MAKEPMKDIIVVLPGILGSVLQKDGKDVWAVSPGAALKALFSLGRSIKGLEVTAKDDPSLDDLGDGVSAPRLLPDIHLIPGLWKIDGYGVVTKHVRDTYDVTPGENYFEFPYDWRRDNRVHGRRLRREAHDWLKAWREKSGNDDAKLVLLAHSMGGLVSRSFLELEDGWKDTRALITFGTPYRGSLNALSFIANGFKKGIGPLGIDLSAFLRSMTSVYQLLPIYKCFDGGDGELVRTTETTAIPHLDADMAGSAMDFHHSIMDRVEDNRKSAEYLEHGYRIEPIVGIGQPTLQSARLSGDRVALLRSIGGDDLGGDGTVPRVSAMPVEMKDAAGATFSPAAHSSLQNTKHALFQVRGVLSADFDPDAFRAAELATIGIDMDDMYGTDESVVVRATAASPGVILTANITNTDTGEEVRTTELTGQDDEWQFEDFGELPEGLYRVTVTADVEAQPVSDVFAVFES